MRTPARLLLPRTRTRPFSHTAAGRNNVHSPPPPPPPPAHEQPSPHAQFYSDLVPAMIPIALLGSAIYLGLELFRSSLAHERHLDDARARIDELEAEIDALVAGRGRSETASPADADVSAAPVKAGRTWWKLW